jgi:predicted  nucleic acid-binding Zn-ribbon protein
MKLLITLQDFDTRMGYILSKKEEGPKKIERLEQRLTDVEMELAEETHQIDEFTRNRREMEQRIEDAESKLKKSNIKLSSIKSNKEYDAAMKEIDDLNKAKLILEEKAIILMEQLEALEAKCAAGREKAAEMKRQFEMDRDAVTRSIKALEQDLHALEQERLSVSRAVDAALLKRYDTLRERRGGIAVSPVIQGVCQTCHIRIPPQEFNELIRGDQLMTCPHCARIIYWGDDGQYASEEMEKSD